MQPLVLINTLSRGYHIPRRRRLLNTFIRRRKAKVILLSTKGDFFSEHKDTIAQHDRVIVAGGDGTFESALNCVYLQKKHLGFFPLGAGNALYSYLYKGKGLSYVQERFPFHKTNLDVLELEWDGRKRQTLFVSVGLDAEVMRLLKRTKGHPVRDMLHSLFRALFLARSSFHIKGDVDGTLFSWKDLVTITLAKIPFYGFGIRSFNYLIEPTDGNVHGIAISKTTQRVHNKILRIIALFKSHFGRKREPLHTFVGKKMVLSSTKTFPLQAGGEYLGTTKEIKISVKRQQTILII